MNSFESDKEREKKRKGGSEVKMCRHILQTSTEIQHAILFSHAKKT